MDIGLILFGVFAGIVVIAWLTIDDEDFNERFEHNRKARFEDEEI